MQKENLNSKWIMAAVKIPGFKDLSILQKINLVEELKELMETN